LLSYVSQDFLSCVMKLALCGIMKFSILCHETFYNVSWNFLHCGMKFSLLYCVMKPSLYCVMKPSLYCVMKPLLCHETFLSLFFYSAIRRGRTEVKLVVKSAMFPLSLHFLTSPSICRVIGTERYRYLKLFHYLCITIYCFWPFCSNRILLSFPYFLSVVK